MIELLGLTLDELRRQAQAWDLPAYRGNQLYHALYSERRWQFDRMTNLPGTLRERLQREAIVSFPTIESRYPSADGAVRYVLRLDPRTSNKDLSPEELRSLSPYGGTRSSTTTKDSGPEEPRLSERGRPSTTTKGLSPEEVLRTRSPTTTKDLGPEEPRLSERGHPSATTKDLGPEEPRLSERGRPSTTTIETVWMPETDRQTLCLSSQAGCAVDCSFCATAQLGLVRNLTAGEIVGQVLAVLAEHQNELRPQTNVVLMGQGEPLLNYDATLKAVRLLADPEGIHIPLRKITLSTSGIIPGIRRLALEEMRPKLAVSLNATTDEQRETLMPLNRKYPLADLLAACRDYPLRPWERLTFEYVLLGGFNDTPEDARRLVALTRGLHCKVNLIPWNAVPSLPYRAPSDDAVEAFQEILRQADILAFIRRSRGQDVFAACGQLSLLEITH